MVEPTSPPLARSEVARDHCWKFLQSSEERTVCLILVICLLAPFVGPLLDGDQVVGLANGDAGQFWYFVYGFGADCWKSGNVPLWNPYAELGYSFIGESQGGAFYPLTVLFTVFDFGPALNLFLAIHFLLAGLFYYGFLRCLKLSATAGGIATLVLCYSSLFVSRFHSGHVSVVAATTWGLGVIFSWQAYHLCKKNHWLLLLSLFYGLMILAGFPYIVLAFSLFLVLYSVTSVLCTVRRGNYFPADLKIGLQGLTLTALSLVLGIGIGMISLLPSYVYAGESFRQHITYEFASYLSYPPENALTLLFPWFLGRGPDALGGNPTPYFGQAYLWEVWVYLGIAPLLATVVGMMRSPWKTKIPLLTCLSFFVIMALGKYTPIHRVLFDYVPLFNLFRGSSRCMIVVIVCLSTFAAFGFQAWMETDTSMSKRSRWAVSVMFLCSLLGLAAALHLHFARDFSGLDGNWAKFLQWTTSQAESYTQPIDVLSSANLVNTWKNSDLSLFRTSILALLTAALFLGARRISNKRYIAAAILLLVAADLGPVFSDYFVTFRVQTLARFVASVPAELSESEGLPKRVIQFSPFQNLGMARKFSTLGGYLGNSSLRYNTFINRALGLTKEASRDHDSEVDRLSAHFASTAVGFWLFGGSAGSPDDPNVILRNKDFTLVRADPSAPRIFLAAQPRSVESPDAALEAVLTEGLETVAAPVVERLTEAIPPAPVAASESASVTDFSVNSITLKVISEQQRLLVVTEMADNDWKAQVNGRDVPVYVANYLFRSVIVPPGESVVEFTYRPTSYLWGRGVSLASLLLWLVLALSLRFSPTLSLARQDSTKAE